MELIREVRQADDTTVVKLSGRLDAEAAPEAKFRLRELASSGQGRLVLNLRELSFLDSAGLGVLVGCLRRCVASGGDLCLVEVPELIRSILELTRLTCVFQITQSESDAVRFFREGRL